MNSAAMDFTDYDKEYDGQSEIDVISEAVPSAYERELQKYESESRENIQQMQQMKLYIEQYKDEIEEAEKIHKDQRNRIESLEERKLIQARTIETMDCIRELLHQEKNEMHQDIKRL